MGSGGSKNFVLGDDVNGVATNADVLSQKRDQQAADMRSFLCEAMPRFASAHPISIRDIISERYTATVSNCGHNGYGGCTFLVHCAANDVVFGFYLCNGAIIVACYPGSLH